MPNKRFGYAPPARETLWTKTPIDPIIGLIVPPTFSGKRSFFGHAATLSPRPLPMKRASAVSGLRPKILLDAFSYRLSDPAEGVAHPQEPYTRLSP